MPIRVLEKNVCELIAAGEVVERPASVVKELVENAIDAGAHSIEVELRKNGLELIRVSDDGCGIPSDELPTAFLRHATSKVAKKEDLEAIGTLGFRGEALAAVCAVAKVRAVSRTRDGEAVQYRIEGGCEVDMQPVGAPCGTSIYVNELFYNTPARMKFLKKDVFEGNAVQSVVEQLSMSHPDIAFKLIREGKTVLSTPGNSDLFSALFCVFPRETADNMLEIEPFVQNNIAVCGYVSKPAASRASRSLQFTYVNGRLVKSPAVCAAAEEAYKNLIMVNKRPAFVLCIALDTHEVDINVHPAKTQVRFRCERDVTSAVYHALKNELERFASSSARPLSATEHPFAGEPIYEAPKTHSAAASTIPKARGDFWNEVSVAPTVQKADGGDFLDYISRQSKSSEEKHSVLKQEPLSFSREAQAQDVKNETQPAECLSDEPQTPETALFSSNDKELVVIGEALKTYIVAQWGDELLLIDKHAAHERLLFEKIRGENSEIHRQLLLEPIVVGLSVEEKQALLELGDTLGKLGFALSDFGEHEVAVREIPTYLCISAVSDAVVQIARNAQRTANEPDFTQREWLLHSSACRAAIKAGSVSDNAELLKIARDILLGSVPKYCPHGRPVFISFDKRELERRFGRIQ